MSKTILLVGSIFGIVLYLMLYTGFTHARITELESRINEQNTVIEELVNNGN